MAVSRTAGYVALYRALERLERHREPLFRDPFARAFIPSDTRFALAAARVPFLHTLVSRYAEWRAPGARTSAIARTRVIDDFVSDRARGGTKQLVLLGAGFDCRAHRLDELRDTRVFEVDQEATQAIKRERLGSFPNARTDVRYVAVDFLRDDPAGRLAAAGWDASQATTFVWEGVTNYLSADAVARVLSWIGGTAARSAILFTYIHAGVLDGSIDFLGGGQIQQNVRGMGEPWTFGIDPAQIQSFLASFGLRLREDLGADDYRRRYLPASELGMAGYAFYRLAVAEVG